MGVDLNGNGSYEASETITYDAIGNPTSYLGNDLLWTGRELYRYQNDNFRNTYYYDSEGLRSRKNIYVKNENGGFEYNGKVIYQYLGGLLTYQCTYNAADEVDTEMYFFYDSYGKLTAIRYIKGTTNHYYYVTTNMQGDVLGIYSASGALLASYDYDAWGNCTVDIKNSNYTIGNDNPIRYRSYYYDTDTGLYYLQSRYYDATIGRFINADGYITTGQGVLSYNMFAYCGNNPIAFLDPTGYCYGYANNPNLGLPTSGARYGILCGMYGNHVRRPKKTGLSDTGAAKPYVEMSGSNDPNSPNCYAYAISSPVNEQPGGASGREYSDITNVEDVGASVVADMNAKGYSVRRLYGGANQQVYANEYKIALRVGTQPYGYDQYGNLYYDYHFMRQTDTGCWAEKHGYGGSSVLWDFGMTPDTIPWTLGDVPYYDSEIIYYAIGY